MRRQYAGARCRDGARTSGRRGSGSATNTENEARGGARSAAMAPNLPPLKLLHLLQKPVSLG